MLRYPIDVYPDGDRYLVMCHDLPEVATDADTLEEVPARAADAIEEALAGRLADFDTIAAPSGGDLLSDPIPTLTALKVALKLKLEEQGMNRAELARVLGWNRNSVDRLFQPRHGTKIEQFDAAFRALGAVAAFQIQPLAVA